MLLLVNKPTYEKRATAERSNFAEMTEAFAIEIGRREHHDDRSKQIEAMLPVTTRVTDERTRQRVSRSYYSQSTISQSAISFRFVSFRKVP